MNAQLWLSVLLMYMYPAQGANHGGKDKLSRVLKAQETVKTCMQAMIVAYMRDRLSTGRTMLRSM